MVPTDLVHQERTIYYRPVISHATKELNTRPVFKIAYECWYSSHMHVWSGIQNGRHVLTNKLVKVRYSGVLNIWIPLFRAKGS